MTPLPFEVEFAAGGMALARRESLLTEGRGYPILAGLRDGLAERFEGHEQAGDVERCIDAAREIDVETWLAQRAAADPDYYAEERGDWPDDVEPASVFTGPLDLRTGEPVDAVALMLVPAQEPWQVPCWLGYGDWNECPGPAAHGAVLKRWEEQYGARVVTMTDDTIELAVERPPTTRADALTLAREQYIYCADIVQQGTETIERLAATLLGGTVWYFWWD